MVVLHMPVSTVTSTTCSQGGTFSYARRELMMAYVGARVVGLSVVGDSVVGLIVVGVSVVGVGVLGAAVLE